MTIKEYLNITPGGRKEVTKEYVMNNHGYYTFFFNGNHCIVNYQGSETAKGVDAHGTIGTKRYGIFNSWPIYLSTQEEIDYLEGKTETNHYSIF